MKSRKQIIRQCIVLSLLVILQAVSLIHIASMPRFYIPINKSQSSSSIDILHKNQSAGSVRTPFQRGIENSRKVLITPPNKDLVLIVSFFLGSLISLAIIKKRNTHLIQPGVLSPSSYLRLCTLRIWSSLAISCSNWLKHLIDRSSDPWYVCIPVSIWNNTSYPCSFSCFLKFVA